MICPGISFGLANVELPLALLLYHFDWKLPIGLNYNDLDMTETIAVTASRENNLLLLATMCDPDLALQHSYHFMHFTGIICILMYDRYLQIFCSVPYLLPFFGFFADFSLFPLQFVC